MPNAGVIIGITTLLTTVIGIAVGVASDGSGSGETKPPPPPPGAIVKPGYTILPACAGFTVQSLFDATLFARTRGASMPQGTTGKDLATFINDQIFGGKCLGADLQLPLALQKAGQFGQFVVEMLRNVLEGATAANRMGQKEAEAAYQEFLGQIATLGLDPKAYPDELFMIDAALKRPGYQIAGGCGLLQVLDEPAALAYARTLGKLTPPMDDESTIGQFWANDLWGVSCLFNTGTQFTAIAKSLGNLPFLWKMLRAALQGAVEGKVVVGKTVITKPGADSILVELQVKMVAQGFPVEQMQPTTV